MLVLVLGAVFNADGAFFALGTHTDTLAQNAAYGVLALGMTIVVVAGGIDLSVGSVVALSAVSFAILVMRHNVPLAVALPAAGAVGALCGAVSGLLAGPARVPAFVATLAMMAAARGVAKWTTDGVKVQKFPYPAPLELLNAKVGAGPVTVSIHVLVFILCAIGVTVLLRSTVLGRRMYAVGDNPTAAAYAGLPVRRTTVLAYIFCGTLAGIAGVLVCALERQGNPDGGIGYELTAIAAVVVGGTPLSGGRGGAVLTVLGTLTIGYIRKILDLNAVGTAQQLVITAGIIVLAVLVQRFRAGPEPR